MQCSTSSTSMRCPSSNISSHGARSTRLLYCRRRLIHAAPAATRSSQPSAAAQPDTACQAQRQQLLDQLRSGGVALMSALVVLSAMEHPLPAHAARQPKVREEIEGPARIVDGDTLWIDSTKIRLFGVDAPEKKQACADALGKGYMCGQEAWAALQEHVGSAPVHCVVRNKDQYGRSVATCGIERGGGAEEDMGAWLVANGHAVAYRQYSKSYVALEEQAHEQSKGVWQGQFTMPYEWRKAQRSHKQELL